jgi:hypothetical protein
MYGSANADYWYAWQTLTHQTSAVTHCGTSDASQHAAMQVLCHNNNDDMRDTS